MIPRQEDRRLIPYEGDAHLLCVAPTVSGKGRDLIIPNLLTYQGPVIVIDPRGERKGRSPPPAGNGPEGCGPLPFGLVTEDTGCLNPFDVFDLEGSDPESDAEMLASQLAAGHFTSDPFWTDNASGLVSGLISHVESLVLLCQLGRYPLWHAHEFTQQQLLGRFEPEPVADLAMYLRQ